MIRNGECAKSGLLSSDNEKESGSKRKTDGGERNNMTELKKPHLLKEPPTAPEPDSCAMITYLLLPLKNGSVGSLFMIS